MSHRQPSNILERTQRWRHQPQHSARDTLEIRERALAVVSVARFYDTVEQWKSQALRTIEQKPRHSGTRRIRQMLGFELVADWFKDAWRAHDAALGVEKLIAEAEVLLQADNPTGAMHIARRALAHALLGEYRTRLWLITGWAGIGQRDPFLTHTALQQLPAAARTLELVAAYLTTCNRADEATNLLTAARRAGYRSRATSKQLIDLLMVHGSAQEAAHLAVEDCDLLSDRDLQALAAAGLAVSRKQPKPCGSVTEARKHD